MGYHSESLGEYAYCQCLSLMISELICLISKYEI
jgi:hypothetical protein